MLIVIVTPERNGVIDPETVIESPTVGLVEEAEQEMLLSCLLMLTVMLFDFSQELLDKWTLCFSVKPYWYFLEKHIF
jgi:hypothetical protein